MPVESRRYFLKGAAAAGLALTTERWLDGIAAALAETAGQAQVIVDPSRRISELDKNVFGAFLEHLGRAVYGGVYEPGSRLADSHGFRKDVLEEIRKVSVPIVRYPGGNFVSGYNWLDGVGPKGKRPRVLDRAWNTLDSNQFGTNEFIAWCRLAGTDPLLTVNLGTGTPETAAALVEYCNVEQGTRWSNLRREHGFEKPHSVKSWCLGNEMDGPWQIGHMPASEYGRKAADAARQMRVLDRSLQLIACGSSNPSMPSYLEWDWQVLQQCYNVVDAITLHRYFSNATTGETAGDSSKFLALNLTMERQIGEVAGVCDLVRARIGSTKKLCLAFTEWNVWYRARGGDGKMQEAPRLLEEVYNLEDALLVGGIVNTLLRQSRRVRLACLAQLVNVIAPLVTNTNGVLRQSIYYPYVWALQMARGYALDLWADSPVYEVAGVGPVPYLDVAGTIDPGNRHVALFILNRDLAKARDLEIIWHEAAPSRILTAQTLTGTDLKAFNTFEDPLRVSPRAIEPPKIGPRMTFQVPPSSYSVIQWQT